MISLSTNGSSFRAAMNSRAANLKIGTQRRIVLFALQMHQNLVLATPILTGKAKAEWQVGLDEQPTQELLPRERPPTLVDYDTFAQSEEAKLQDFSSGQTIYITNLSPYIAALNSGYSRQAPAGFVEDAQNAALNALRATV